MDWIEIICELGAVVVQLPTDRFYVISAIVALILVQNMKR